MSPDSSGITVRTTMTITMVRWIGKTIAPTQRDLQTPTSKVARTATEMPSATKPTSAQTSMENPTTTEMGAQIRTAMAFQMLTQEVLMDLNHGTHILMD